ncbi:MAG: PAS domain S-box protein [Gemmatimonadaceae bacterium]
MPSSLSAPRATAGLLALVAAIFALTLAVPDSIATWLLYAAPLLLSARLPGARAPFIMAAVATVLMLGAFPLQHHSGIPPAILLSNRAMGAGVFWMAAVLMVRSRDKAITATLHAQQLARAQEIARIGSWERDVVTGVPIWSAETYRICETDPSVVPTREYLLSIIHPDDRARVAEFIARQETGVAHVIEYRLLLGTRVKYVLNHLRFLERNGEVTTVVGTMQDITELREADLARVQTQELLEQQGELMRLALGIADIGLWRADFRTGASEFLHDGGPFTAFPAALRPRTIAEYYEIVHPDDRAMLQDTLEEAAREDRAHHVDYRIVTPAGIRWIAAYGYTFRDADGKPVEIIRADLDITERKAAEQFRAQQAAMVQSADDAILTASLDGTVTSWNLGAQRMFGYTEAEVVGKSLRMFIPPDQVQGATRNTATIASGATIRGYETTRLRKDGTVLMVSLTISPILPANGKVEGASFIARDLTDRERTAHQLRALSRRLESAQEAERSAIARDVHDDLGQSLLAIRLELRRLSGLVDVSSPAATLVNELNALTEASMARTRAIALALHPSALDDLGLGAAISIHARRVAEVSGLTMDLDVDEELELDKQVATAAYRILQEGLTNVVRHAGATEVHVVLRSDADSVVLEVTDNGRGITQPELERSESLGLLGMRERAAIFNGDVSVTAVAPSGTRVTLRIPGACRMQGAA